MGGHLAHIGLAHRGAVRHCVLVCHCGGWRCQLARPVSGVNRGWAAWRCARASARSLIPSLPGVVASPHGSIRASADCWATPAAPSPEGSPQGSKSPPGGSFWRRVGRSSGASPQGSRSAAGGRVGVLPGCSSGASPQGLRSAAGGRVGVRLGRSSGASPHGLRSAAGGRAGVRLGRSSGASPHGLRSAAGGRAGVRLGRSSGASPHGLRSAAGGRAGVRLGRSSGASPQGLSRAASPGVIQGGSVSRGQTRADPPTVVASAVPRVIGPVVVGPELVVVGGRYLPRGTGSGVAQVGRVTWTTPWVMRMVQWPAWRSRWQRLQSRTRLVSLVAPPSIQWTTWWASQ